MKVLPVPWFDGLARILTLKTLASGQRASLYTTFRGWSATLAGRSRLVVTRVAVQPLGFMVGFGLFGPFSFLVHCMGLKHLCSLTVVCCHVLRFCMLFGRASSLLPMLVRFELA